MGSLETFHAVLLKGVPKVMNKVVHLVERRGGMCSWWLDELETQSRTIRRLGQRVQRMRRRFGSVSTELLSEFKTARLCMKHLIVTAKKEFWRATTEQLSTANMWSSIKRLCSSYNPVSLTHVYNQAGVMVTSPKDVRHRLLQKFFPTNPSPLTPQQIRITKEVESWDAQLHEVHYYDFLKVTMHELKKTLKHMGSFKAAGRDELPVAVFKHSPSLTSQCLQLYNLSLYMRQLPRDFKAFYVVAVPKEQGHQNRVGKLRPISLLPSMSKLLERVIDKRLHYHLELNSPLHDRQFGFRSGRSTIDALLMLSNKIGEQWNTP